MEFIFLPYLLLSHIPMKLPFNNWPYGPEYNYRVNVNVTNLHGYDFNKTQLYHSSTTLQCRPQKYEGNALNCRFGDFTTNVYQANKPTVNHEIDDVWQLREPFKIVFDHRGIRKLVVNRLVRQYNIEIIQEIVGQLNLGVQILDKPDGTFNETENFYLNECESTVNLSRVTRNDVSSRDTNFEILPMNGFRKSYSETMTIDKRRNPKSCRDEKFGIKNIFTGSSWTMRMSAVKEGEVSSHSRMVISDTGYDSYTVNIINVTFGETRAIFYEKTFLNLISVSPAEGPLPAILNSTDVNSRVERSRYF